MFTDASRTRTAQPLADRIAGDRPGTGATDFFYADLYALSAQLMASERQDHTLSPIALAHEAYLLLQDRERFEWRSRQHFRAIAAQVIRRVLVDHARARASAKRGGRHHRLDMTPARIEANGRELDFVALEEALTALSRAAPRQARLVELRFYGGLKFEEIAQALGISVATAKRDWDFARAWLYRSLAPDR